MMIRVALANSQIRPNAFYTILRPFNVLKRTNIASVNSDPVFKKVTLRPGDEIHYKSSGVFGVKTESGVGVAFSIRLPTILGKDDDAAVLHHLVTRSAIERTSRPSPVVKVQI